MAKKSRRERKAERRIHPRVQAEETIRSNLFQSILTDQELWALLDRALDLLSTQVAGPAYRLRMLPDVSSGSVAGLEIAEVEFPQDHWAMLTERDRERTLATIRRDVPKLNQYVVADAAHDPLWDLLMWCKNGDMDAPRPVFSYRLLNGNPCIFTPDGKVEIPRDASDAEVAGALAFRKALAGASLGGPKLGFRKVADFPARYINAYNKWNEDRDELPSAADIAAVLGYSKSRFYDLLREHSLPWPPA